AVRAVNAGRRIGEEAAAHVALDDGGVVAVGGQHAARAGLGAAPYHLEQRLRLRFALDGELRVEDLVTAVLAVRLREHHQLDVGGIATQPVIRVDQVGDL